MGPGNTAKGHSRFEYLSDLPFPVFYDLHHGWQSADSGDAKSVWFFDFALNRWWFTDVVSAHSPLMSLEGDKWYYYLEGSTNPRMFFDFAALQWVSENDL